jgi:hypothetical protein
MSRRDQIKAVLWAVGKGLNMNAVQGYKTYIVCGLAIATAIVGHFFVTTVDPATGQSVPQLDFNSMVAAVFAAVGGITARHALTTETAK